MLIKIAKSLIEKDNSHFVEKVISHFKLDRDCSRATERKMRESLTTGTAKHKNFDDLVTFVLDECAGCFSQDDYDDDMAYLENAMYQNEKYFDEED